MSTASPRVYSLALSDVRTYAFAALFIIGNVALPQLCHLIPNGGLMFLPIYFFTLIGAYKYGIHVGLLTAIASPLVNSAIFGMPPAALVPGIMVKGVVLAIAATLIARRTQRPSLLAIAAAVIAYQVIGTAFEWLMGADLNSALQDWRIGLPGMAIQIIGGWLLLNFVIKK